MSQAHALQDTHAGTRHFCQIVGPDLNPAVQQRILVAGCGSGHEALGIRKHFGLPVTGVDIKRSWDPTLGAEIEDFELLEKSILDLPFADNSFDLIFYYHVIEHVSDPALSLKELARVLVPGGLIYVGTPNRHRIVGYLGESVPKVTRLEKLRWNWVDYKARLRNRFRNEYGAHAGFSMKELSKLLSQRFTDVRFLTADYIRFKYGDRLPRPALEIICAPPILEVAASSIYAVARKPAA